MMRKQCLPLALLVVFSALRATAQFGGRTDEVVIYAVTSKGSGDFQVFPPGTTNSPQSASRFEVFDSAVRPSQPFGPDFPTQSRQLLHQEPDNLFQLISYREGQPPSPRHVFLTTAKVFILKGFLRELKDGISPPLDFTSNAYAPFEKSIDVGPNFALVPFQVLYWAPATVFPAIAKVDPDFVSPLVAPGQSGPDYVSNLAKLPLTTRWVPLRDTYPAAGWPFGVDLKTLDVDPALGNITTMIRLRKGARTPAFGIAGDSHLFVLQGSAVLTPAGSSPIAIRQGYYAFLPAGFSIVLTNEAPYKGPR